MLTLQIFYHKSAEKKHVCTYTLITFFMNWGKICVFPDLGEFTIFQLKGFWKPLQEESLTDTPNTEKGKVKFVKNVNITLCLEFLFLEKSWAQLHPSFQI